MEEEPQRRRLQFQESMLERLGLLEVTTLDPVSQDEFRGDWRNFGLRLTTVAEFRSYNDHFPSLADLVSDDMTRVVTYRDIARHLIRGIHVGVVILSDADLSQPNMDWRELKRYVMDQLDNLHRQVTHIWTWRSNCPTGVDNVQNIAEQLTVLNRLTEKTNIFVPARFRVHNAFMRVALGAALHNESIFELNTRELNFEELDNWEADLAGVNPTSLEAILRATSNCRGGGPERDLFWRKTYRALSETPGFPNRFNMMKVCHLVKDRFSSIQILETFKMENLYEGTIRLVSGELLMRTGLIHHAQLFDDPEGIPEADRQQWTRSISYNEFAQANNVIFVSHRWRDENPDPEHGIIDFVRANPGKWFWIDYCCFDWEHADPDSLAKIMIWFNRAFKDMEPIQLQDPDPHSRLEASLWCLAERLLMTEHDIPLDHVVNRLRVGYEERDLETFVRIVSNTTGDLGRKVKFLNLLRRYVGSP